MKKILVAALVAITMVMAIPLLFVTIAMDTQEWSNPCAASIGAGPQGWTSPAAGPVSSSYGGRGAPVAGASTQHHGTDIAAPYDAPIYAAADGTVTISGTQPSNCGPVGYVRIDHGGGIVTNYLHMEPGKIRVHTGDTVKAGQQIAQVGSTGCSSGAHLHFEVMVNSHWVDPEDFMSERGITLGILSDVGNVKESTVTTAVATISTPLQWAYTQTGKPYIYGGNGPKGYDCSGLVYAAFKETLGIILPRTAKAQKNNPESYGGQYVEWNDESDLQPGDLLFYPDGSHVAFYAGPGIIFHAPNVGFTITEAAFNPGEYSKKAVRVDGANGPGGSICNGATGDTSTDGVKATAKEMMKSFGWTSEKEYECLVQLWEHESGWNYTATNPSSGAYGIAQALPASKMSSAGADWKTNPSTQIKWGLGYIRDRYKTPCGAWSFWQHPNIYVPGASGNWY